MATKCEYCGSVTNGISLFQTNHKVNTYGQKNHKSSDSEMILCSLICLKASNRATVRAGILKFISIFTTGMLMIKKVQFKNDAVTFSSYMLKTIEFLKADITKKEFLAFASEALEEATEEEDESYLKFVCFTQARAVVLRDLAEEVKLKINFL